jgi:hypothetical protein
MNHPLLILLAAIALAWPPPQQKLTFVFKGNQQGLAILEPMTPVESGVTWESGSRQMAAEEVLQCTAKQRSRPVIVKDKDGGMLTGTLNETMLDCGDRVLAVKAVEFQ